MSVTHGQLASYIGATAFKGNRYDQWRAAWRNVARVGVAPLRQPPIPPLFPRKRRTAYKGEHVPLETLLYFAPSTVTAYCHYHLLRISFPWPGGEYRSYFPELESLEAEDIEYISEMAWDRMEPFLQRMWELPHDPKTRKTATLFSADSPLNAKLNLKVSPSGMWYAPTPARIRQLDLALEGLKLLPEQYPSETTEERISRLANAGQDLADGMPIEYALELWRP